MTVELEYKGKKYRVETIQEAVELQHQLDQHEAIHGSFHREPLPRVWTADLAMDLLNGIGEMQKKFLAVLSKGSLTSSDLAEQMGMSSEIALAGVVSGLSKQLGKMSITPSSLYRVDVAWKDKHKIRSFVLSSDFRDALTELGWPEVWQAGKEKDAASTKTKRFRAI